MKMSPYAHKLSCNLVKPIAGVSEDACTCGSHEDACIHNANYPAWLKGSALDTLCDCGLTFHHRDCNAFSNDATEGAYRLMECTCGFSPPATITWGSFPEIKEDTVEKVHNPDCVHLSDPYAACNCALLPDDTEYRDWLQKAQAETWLDETTVGHFQWCNTQQDCNCTGPKAMDKQLAAQMEADMDNPAAWESDNIKLEIRLDNPTKYDYDDIIKVLDALKEI